MVEAETGSEFHLMRGHNLIASLILVVALISIQAYSQPAILVSTEVDQGLKNPMASQFVSPLETRSTPMPIQFDLFAHAGSEKSAKIGTQVQSDPIVEVTVRTLWNSESCAVSELGGVQIRNGGNYSFASGTYPAIAFNCYGYPWVNWSASGGVEVISAQGNTSKVLVNGNGSLDVLYFAPKYSVTFGVYPSVCPGLSFNGTVWPNRSHSTFFPEIYKIGAPSCAGYQFANWSTQSTPINNLSVYCISSFDALWGASSCSNTQARVLGNSTLIALYSLTKPTSSSGFTAEDIAVLLTASATSIAASWIIWRRRRRGS
jgi:hypothetical protein